METINERVLTKENILCIRQPSSSTVKFMMCSTTSPEDDNVQLLKLCKYLGSVYNYDIRYQFYHIPMPDNSPDMSIMQMLHEGPNGARITVDRWEEYKKVAYKEWKK